VRAWGYLKLWTASGGGGVDLEELVELGDGEDLVDLGVDVGEAELAALGVDLVADGDGGPRGRPRRGGRRWRSQMSRRGRGLASMREASFLPDVLDVGLVEDVAVDELDLG